jgi:FkbM family methyltransferase
MPDTLTGRGIVTSCGADRVDYLLNAYVQFRLIRELGCKLPIECWYAGARERSEPFAELVRPLGVTCRDAVAAGFVGHPIAKDVPFRVHSYEPAQLHGYSLKPFAILASSFAEVVWLDADCHPIVSPEAAFEQDAYMSAGALVWADDPNATYHYPRLEPFGLTTPPGEENGWETGQMVLDKRRHWRALQLANWFCATADHWFQHVWGDKDALFAAWLVEQAPYRLGAPEVFQGRCFLHRLPDGRPYVLHRAGGAAKLKLGEPDPLENPPHEAVIDDARDEFVRWHARANAKRNGTTFAGIRHGMHLMADMPGGRKLCLPEGDEDVSRFIRLHGEWEPETTAYLRRTVQPGWRCVDVGANVGWFAILMADLAGPAGQTIAVEPLAELCDCIRESAAAYGFEDRLTVVEAAAAETEGGSLRLNLHASKLGFTTERVPFDWTPAEMRDAKTVTLDRLLGSWGRCDLIKIDVEGCEPRVVRGARAILEKHRPLLLVEFLPRHCDDAADWLAELRRIGEIRSIEAGGFPREVTTDELLADRNRLRMLEVRPRVRSFEDRRGVCL